MLDALLAQLAFRARAASLVVATTGSATLSATATGYARATGSFIADGFLPGMELTPAGFPQTTAGIITNVAPLTITIAWGRTITAAASGRSLIAGLPEMRAYENAEFAPDPSRPYVSEEWVPGGSSIKTWPTKGGRLDEDGLSLWHWYGLPKYDVAAISRSVLALKALFAAGTILDLGDGTSVRVRGDTTVKHSQIRRINSWAVCTVTIPWRASTENVIAA